MAEHKETFCLVCDESDKISTTVAAAADKFINRTAVERMNEWIDTQGEEEEDNANPSSIHFFLDDRHISSSSHQLSTARFEYKGLSVPHCLLM